MTLRTRAIAVSVVAAAAFGMPLLANSQPRDNDYYSSRGTTLLLTVEKYHLGLGEQEFRARRFDAAYRDFKFILDYFPNHPQALLLMAQNCEQWKSSVCNVDEFFARGIARNPGVPATHVTYGVYLLRVGKSRQAIESLNRALELDPQSVNAHYNIALAYLETNQFDLANAHAQKAYALGAPLGGLRDRLTRAGHWRPDESTPVSSGTAASAPSTPK